MTPEVSRVGQFSELGPTESQAHETKIYLSLKLLNLDHDISVLTCWDKLFRLFMLWKLKVKRFRLKFFFLSLSLINLAMIKIEERQGGQNSEFKSLVKIKIKV